MSRSLSYKTKRLIIIIILPTLHLIIMYNNFSAWILTFLAIMSTLLSNYIFLIILILLTIIPESFSINSLLSFIFFYYSESYYTYEHLDFCKLPPSSILLDFATVVVAIQVFILTSSIFLVYWLSPSILQTVLPQSTRYHIWVLSILCNI